MADTYRILVTGSRDWADENLIAGALLHEVSRRPASDTIVIVHGAARGADVMANRVALHYEWQIERHPADWERFGRQADVIRNAEMVKAGADVCLAWIIPCARPGCGGGVPHGSHGATHCADLAAKAGIHVRRFLA